MKNYFCAFILMSTFNSFALAQIEQKSKNALTHTTLTSTFKADLKEGFHFNEKAPNKITLDDKTIKPTKLTARSVEFTKLPKMKKSARASLFVCDDGLTTCEMHSLELGKTIAAKTETKTATKSTDDQVNEHGFIEDDLQQALTQAAQHNSLVLIDFSARWCPSCVRLETEIFDLPEFKSLTSSFVKVKIDTDRFENTVIAEKFKVVGIPTLLVINSKQQEVDRILDYQPMTQLRRFFNSLKKDPIPIADLQQKVSFADDELLLTIGQRLLSAGRLQESVDVLSKLKSAPTELWEAKVALGAEKAKKDKAKKEYEQILRAAIADEPDSSRSIGWRRELADLLESQPSERQKVVSEGVALADQLLANKEKLLQAIKTDRVGEFTDFEPLMIAMARADLIEVGEGGKDNPTTTDAWLKAANSGTLLNIDADHEGTAVRYLIVLMKAKLWSEADALALSLLQKNPKNVDIERRRLKVLLELKKYNEAIDVGNRVLKKSYGRNEFWVAESLAKSYLAAKKKKEARALIERYLSRSEMDWSNLESSKKALLELKKQTL